MPDMAYLVLGLAIGLFLGQSNRSMLERRIATIERTVRQVADKVGVEEPEINAEVRDLIDREGKIPAIKRLREATGMGLKEAKEYVDSL